MEVKLIIEQPRVRKRTLRLRTDEGVIGRASGCAIRIGSAEVSRQHCRLRVRDGYLTVEDLKSSNGTQLNGEDVKGRQVVRPGDRLRVGPVTFIVEYQLTPEAIDRLLRGEGESVAGEEFEVIEAEPALEFDEEGLLPMEEAAEDADAVEAEVVEEAPAEVVDELEMVDTEDMQLPQAEELRDLLTGLDEEEEDPPPKRKKKR
jgi:pSer/pThr/pTyr-binding forkhead associated (FHA) protein